MDFGSQYPQFATAPPGGHGHQPYANNAAQFMQMPGQHQPHPHQQHHQPQQQQHQQHQQPLTPSNSHSVTSEDFNPSPPDAYGDLNNGDQYNNFEYAQNFGHQNPGFGGPPTPPNQGLFGHQQPMQQHQLHQQHPHTQPRRRSPLSHEAAVPPNGLPNGDLGTLAKQEPGSDEAGQGRGGSDDDENMTPAQSRRKAQNRAAQRAFRERKEKHVKDLEAKLAESQAAQQQASDENEALKRRLQSVSTENEILRATSGNGNGHNSHSPEPMTTGPMRYNPSEFYTQLLQNHDNKTPSHRIVTSDEGDRLLAAGATWDYIINHELYKQGLVNVAEVSDRLKNQAKCDGQGPVFMERTIIEAIQQSVASGSDDLL